jgi:hypothetical protein
MLVSFFGAGAGSHSCRVSTSRSIRGFEEITCAVSNSSPAACAPLHNTEIVIPATIVNLMM